jgi:predicted nucleotidyltransferase
MMPTLQQIIEASKIHPSRIFNIFLFGSRVYGTCNDESDYDFVIVANNSFESIEIKEGIFNIHIYTPDRFAKDLLWHKPNNLECIFSPQFAKLKEDIKPQFILDTRKLRHAISHLSSNSWVKCQKKLQTGEYQIGIKSLFHSLRLPMFATQLCKYGTISDFSCANIYWEKLKSRQWTWDEIDSEFRPIKSEIMHQFRKLAAK